MYSLLFVRDDIYCRIMVIPTTSIAFIVLAIGLSIFGFMFLRAYRKTNTSPTDKRIGLLLSAYFIGFAINTGLIIGLGTLFFAQSPTGLFAVLVGFNIGLTLLGMLGVYTIYYIFFPKDFSLIPANFVLILGIISITFIFVMHPQPLLTTDNGIDWNTPLVISWLIFSLLFISVGSSTYIFVLLFLKAKTTEMKILSFAIAVSGGAGIITEFFRFIVFHHAPIEPRTKFNDFGHGSLGIILAVAFLTLLIMKLRSKKWINKQ